MPASTSVLSFIIGTLNSPMLAAMKCGRNSIGIEIDENYCLMTLDRLKKEGKDLFREVKLEFSRVRDKGRNLTVNEEPAAYKPGKSKKAVKHKT